MTDLLDQQTLHTIRQDFPILSQSMQGQPLIYFDNAATTQKPQAMLDVLNHFYTHFNANSHRGVHQYAYETTEAYEGVRSKIAEYLKVKSKEIIFNSGTTMGINMIAKHLIKPKLQPGDKILVTHLEHHSNLVPWQMLAKETGAELVYMPVDSSTYLIDLEKLNGLLDETVKVVTTHHVSNVIGVEQPLKALSELIRKNTEAYFIVDGAQGAPHLPLDFNTLDVDAYLFSAHKLYGPTGLGIMYLPEKNHEHTEPFFYGGEMIHYVGETDSNFKGAPWRYEAGTQPIAQVIAFGATLDYLATLDQSSLRKHELTLTQHLIELLAAIEGIEVYHSHKEPSHGIVSFNIEGVHPHDAASAYDLSGIAVRAGHHCAQPLMRILNVPATLRASLSFYNTLEEVDRFIEVTREVKEFFARGNG